MKSLNLLLVLCLLALASSVYAGSPELQPAPSPSQDENKNSTEIFDYETTYTGNSDFQKYGGKFGDGDSLYNDFSYAHRFLITGNDVIHGHNPARASASVPAQIAAPRITRRVSAPETAVVP